ncbi:putative membrane protein [Burkholderia glumae LMG 2196 = ATCC 33617]|nr:putative membrane protein [Burkholderia glumae LMG 2196 = ATCC 33617]
MTSDWFIAGLVIVGTIVGFVVLGLIGGIKGKQDDNKDHN